MASCPLCHGEDIEIDPEYNRAWCLSCGEYIETAEPRHPKAGSRFAPWIRAMSTFRYLVPRPRPRRHD